MCSILVVEDNVTFRKSLIDILMLRFPAVEILEASDGEEAILEVQKTTPDLIFMDIKLPGKNGLEVTRIIKKIRPEIEVIVITSFDIPEYREAAFQSGASHFFVKGNAGADELAQAVNAKFVQKGKNPYGNEQASR